jgi:hypothetical protein
MPAGLRRVVNLGGFGPIDGADTGPDATAVDYAPTVRGRQAQDCRHVNPGKRVLRELAAG